MSEPMKIGQVEVQNDTKHLLEKIIGYCYSISTQTKADAFFDYAPHTSEITVRIYPDGWTSESDCINISYKEERSTYFEYYGPKILETVIQKLEKIYRQYLLKADISREVET